MFVATERMVAIETGQLTKFLYRQAKMVTPKICSEMFILSLRKRTLSFSIFFFFFSLNNVGKHVFPQSQLCRAYKSCGPGGPPHVKIVVEWDKETKE